MKATPAPDLLPDLPPMLAQGGVDTSSDDLEEEKDAVQEPKRLRSTSTTPRSDSTRAREPFEYDRLMGVGSVGPSSDEGD